jgi:hypothetical protein
MAEEFLDNVHIHIGAGMKHIRESTLFIRSKDWFDDDTHKVLRVVYINSLHTFLLLQSFSSQVP